MNTRENFTRAPKQKSDPSKLFFLISDFPIDIFFVLLRNLSIEKIAR